MHARWSSGEGALVPQFYTVWQNEVGQTSFCWNVPSLPPVRHGTPRAWSLLMHATSISVEWSTSRSRFMKGWKPRQDNMLAGTNADSCALPTHATGLTNIKAIWVSPRCRAFGQNSCLRLVLVSYGLCLKTILICLAHSIILTMAISRLLTWPWRLPRVHATMVPRFTSTHR